MANPLDYLQAVIKLPRKRMEDGTRHMPILHSNGKQMGTLVLERRPFLHELLSYLNFKNFLVVFPDFGFKFQAKILDSDGKCILQLTKPTNFKDFKVTILDYLGRQLGTLQKVPPDSKIDEVSKKGQYNLYDNSGNLLAIFRGDWSSWNMQIFDANEKAIGKICKGHTEVNKVVHGSADFFVAQIYTGTDKPNFRTLVMGVSCAMDLIANL